MSLSLITFANLGKNPDMSAVDIMPIVKKFDETNDLKQVIGRTNTNFNIKNSISAIPKIIYYPIRILQKFFRVPISRAQFERIFDFIAQLRLVYSDVVIFHGGFVFPRLLKKARRLRSITVDIPRLAHLNENSKLEMEEIKLLDLDNFKEYYGEQNKRFNHLCEFDYIIAFSDFVKKTYVDNGFPKENVFIAPQDIDISMFSPSQKTKLSFKVIYIAYSNPLKGLHYLLDAWSELNLPEAELLIVGDYGAMPQVLQERYEKIIRSNSSIKKLGHVDNSKLEQLYQESSVLAFPSLTESLSRVTLEAMACGLPVITTENAKGLVEDGKSGFVIPIRDSKAMKEKIEFLYHNPGIREEMGKEARRAVENKKPFGEAVYEIYQEILRRERTT